MKIIFETSDFGEALVKRARLEQEGFFVYMDNYYWGSAEPYMGMALGYKLWGVPVELEEARACLKDPQNGSVFLLDEYDPINICLACASENVLRFRSAWWLIAHWMMGVMIASPGGNRRKCMDCDHKYKAKGPALTGPFKILIGFWLLFVALAYGAGYTWLPDLSSLR